MAGLVERIGPLDHERPPPRPPRRRLRLPGPHHRRPAALDQRGAHDLRPPHRALRRARADPGRAHRRRRARLREVGLSRQKIRYLRDLATRVHGGELDLPGLHELSDDEVREKIMAVKGLGRWSADMFLMFHLRRPDVLPVGDLGIRRAVERAYGLPGCPRGVCNAGRSRGGPSARSRVYICGKPLNSAAISVRSGP